MPPTAVLLSAGLDSAVLAADEAQRGPIHPIYVSTGLAWEHAELAALDRLLVKTPFAGSVAPLARLSFTVEDLYPTTHWALRGTPPAFDTPDEDVYLVGRNVALLSKSAIHCARLRIDRIALGPLAGNPFPDATPQFFETMGPSVVTWSRSHDFGGCTVPVDGQDRRHQAWIETGRSAGADALLHESAGRLPLWTMQQMPRTPRRISKRWRCRSDDLRHRATPVDFCAVHKGPHHLELTI